MNQVTWPSAAALATVALLVGLVSAWDPLLGLTLAVGLCLIAFVIHDLAVGLSLFTVVAFIDFLGREQSVGLAKLLGAVLLASWAAAIVLRGRRQAPPMLWSDAPWLMIVVVAFVTWAALSAVWAESAAAAFNSTWRYALNAALLPIVYASIRRREHMVWVLLAFLLGANLAAVYGVITASAGAQGARLEGAADDPNELAVVLVVSVVVGAALSLALRAAPVLRLLALAASATAFMAIFATGSRGGLVALMAAILAAALFGGRWRVGPIVIALPLLITAALFFSSTESFGGQRLASTDSSGRVDIWTVGWRMVEANPVLGVGAGNFTISSVHYLLEPGALLRDDLILDDPKVAHNIYLQVLAELGAVGLILFLVLLAVSVKSVAVATHNFRSRGETGMELLSRAILVALIAVLCGFFFLSSQFSVQFWLLLAIGPTLLRLSRSPDETTFRESAAGTARTARPRTGHRS